MTLVMLIGGARSGKSALALRLASEQDAPVVFIATALAGDSEMAERITKHQRERPRSWRTVEEPLRLRESIRGAGDTDCVVVDCLTLWTANALEQLDADQTELLAEQAAGAASARTGLTIAVTNEVGLGIVPENALARGYRDLLGRVNTIWASLAEEVHLLVAGRMLTLEKTDSLGRTLE